MKKERLNLADKLRHFPKGLPLYSTVCGDCELEIVNDADHIYVRCNDTLIEFNKYGQLYIPSSGNKNVTDNGECLLYPKKDQRKWYLFSVADGSTLSYKNAIHSLLEEWIDKLTKKYSFLSFKYEWKPVFNVYVVQYIFPKEKADDEALNKDLLEMSDFFNNLFGDYSPLFSEEDKIFRHYR